MRPCEDQEEHRQRIAQPVEHEEPESPLVGMAVMAAHEPQADQLAELAGRGGEREARDVVEERPAERQVETGPLGEHPPAQPAQEVVDEREGEQGDDQPGAEPGELARHLAPAGEEPGCDQDEEEGQEAQPGRGRRSPRVDRQARTAQSRVRWKIGSGSARITSMIQRQNQGV